MKGVFMYNNIENADFGEDRYYRTSDRIVNKYLSGDMINEDDNMCIPINEEEHGQSSFRPRFEEPLLSIGSPYTCKQIERINKQKERLNLLTLVGDVIEDLTVKALRSL